MRKIGLLPRILIALALGIVCGLFFPPALARVFVTFNGLFGNFLTFIIPLIIVALITPAISELGRGAGRWLGITAAIAYASTLFAGLLALVVGGAVFPLILDPTNAPGSLGNPEDALLAPYFTVEMAPVFGVMTALVLSFVVGLGMTFVPSATMQRGFVELRAIVEKVISGVILPLLPLYIFGIFLNMTVAGQVWSIIVTFVAVIALVFALTVVVLLVQFGIAGAVARRNPLRALATMLPAYATALGTSSSAATIPVTLRQAIKAGVNPPVASFVIPLCATIHLAGSTVKITAFSVAIMVLSGMPIDPLTMVGFVCMLGIAMVAAPGVPGGAIMTAAGLLSSMLGFNEAQVGLMIATYIAIDSFGTATNVTGDGAIALIVDRLSKGRIGEQPPVIGEPETVGA
ncbi:dicarboxylate/amino acid:cation symporter [Propioniciclava coleopterorum]|uniref:Dicarboxylate/amino acid:cation symporter n=1 Tax=Propioniciclava coleopterorum TaxID=2714937 RepID=A0A6G7Y7U7_9ACTN|nr:dicarboxylate/amino acid:cation symporter [Propioniciclava coleopterorum]QIK72687.1 dicarboxylate/amino acid:cation symporter [Propioniciclava coleopterorum]